MKALLWFERDGLWHTLYPNEKISRNISPCGEACRSETSVMEPNAEICDVCDDFADLYYETH